MTVDELQVASAPDLALVAATLHRLNVDHAAAVVLFAGTGLPYLPEALRKAGVTHPDRLFVLESIPLMLEHEDARYAVVEPARQVGISWEPNAATAVVEASNGYPAHVQLLAHAAWTAAIGPDVITSADVETAIPQVALQIERRSFGPRWDRITDRQIEFRAALVLVGGGASTSRIARALGRAQREISWRREELTHPSRRLLRTAPIVGRGPHSGQQSVDTRRNGGVHLGALVRHMDALSTLVNQRGHCSGPTHPPRT